MSQFNNLTETYKKKLLYFYYYQMQNIDWKQKKKKYLYFSKGWGLWLLK